MWGPGVRAGMKLAVLAAVLILSACSSSSGPKAHSSTQPSARPTSTVAESPTPSPTPTVASGLTWAAPVHVDHQPPFSGNLLVGVSCPSTSLCVAVDYSGGNVVTSTNPAGGAAAWTVTNVDGSPRLQSSGVRLSAVSCQTNSLCVAV